MAIPVVSNIRSYAGARVGQACAFQLSASGISSGSNTWAASGLPTGLSIASSTGIISGTPTTAGVYVALVDVNNSVNAQSAQQTFTIQVLPGVAVSGVANRVWLDVLMGMAYGQDPTVELSPEPAVFYGKYNDVLPYEVRLVAGNQLVDVGVVAADGLKHVIKELEPERVLATQTKWRSRGTGASRIWYGEIDLRATAIKGILSGYEEDAETKFTAITEWELTFIPNLASVGTVTANDATDVLTCAGHGLSTGDTVRITSAGTMPGELSSDTLYYLRDVTTDTFKVSTTLDGTAVDVSSAGTGTHTLYLSALCRKSSQTIPFTLPRDLTPN
jgi:hypothetical protein